MSWTDDELRQAIHEAAERAGNNHLRIDHYSKIDLLAEVRDYEVSSLRHLLTALGIDHQPKPELPTEPGSMIYDVVLTSGEVMSVMTLDRYGSWVGSDAEAWRIRRLPVTISSFGGVLDLDKVRGEQGE